MSPTSARSPTEPAKSPGSCKPSPGGSKSASGPLAESSPVFRRPRDKETAPRPGPRRPRRRQLRRAISGSARPSRSRAFAPTADRRRRGPAGRNRPRRRPDRPQGPTLTRPTGIPFWRPSTDEHEKPRRSGAQRRRGPVARSRSRARLANADADLVVEEFDRRQAQADRIHRGERGRSTGSKTDGAPHWVSVA